MKRKTEDGEVREQSSIFYHLSDRMSEASNVFYAHYTHMFIEDISQALLSAWATRRGSKVSVELTPANDDLESMISSALDVSRQGYRHRDLNGALREFLRHTMVELCLARRAVFEIVYLRPREKEPRHGFDLVYLSSRQIISRFGRWYQKVPSEIARENQVTERIRLPSKNIVVFTLPPHLVRTVASVMQALKELSDHSWHNLALESQKGRLPYDFSSNARTRDLALAETLREIGWTARGSFSDRVTNYYSLRQDLLFRLFAMEIREALLGQLNALLRRVGSELNWSTQISINGLAMRADLEQALTGLVSGKKPFTETMNAVRGL